MSAQATEQKPEKAVETPEQEAIQAAEQKRVYEKFKADSLKRAHENLRKLSHEQRVAMIQRFHTSVVQNAKNLRMQAKIPKYHAETIEAQTAKKMQAVKHEGLWVQGYLGDIPVLVVETIEAMKKDIKWAKDRP